jgi:GNAT superfamily N-acetyltransferase
MSINTDFTIRSMNLDEVRDIAVEWAAREGWNPGLYDAPCFYNTDPKGFFVGLLGDEPISCISVINYDNQFAFLGFYITKPEYRGKGYGLQLWKHGIKYGQGMNIGLDGVIEQQPNYKKSGFKLAYSNIRYEGDAIAADEDYQGIIQLSSIPFDEIAKYDSAMFPAPRSGFLKCWIEQPESKALAAVDGNRLEGYAVLRKCRAGYKIGPLFADNPDIAERLFLALNSAIPAGTKIYLDTPEINPQAVAIAEKYDMQEVFGTARMYTGPQPDIDLNRIFGVTTFELG